MNRIVRVSPDAAATARDVATFVLRTLADAIEMRGSASFVVAGGSTPMAVYRLLAENESFRWHDLDVFFGDDRYVPVNSRDRNERAVREAWLDHVSIPADRIHAMPAAPEGADDDEAAGARPSLDEEAARYEATVRRVLERRTERRDPSAPPTTFDLVLLGVGPDGHTASLFPGDPALDVQGRLVAGVPRSPTPPEVPRLTLTLEAIRASRAVAMLATGRSKCSVVAEILGAGDPTDDTATASSTALPAGRTRSQTGSVLWFLDAAAAGDGPLASG